MMSPRDQTIGRAATTRTPTNLMMSREFKFYLLDEHVPPSETLYVLRTWHDSLTPGGFLILGVPDLDYVIGEYMNDPQKFLYFWRSGFDSMVYKQLYGAFYAHNPEPDNDRFRHYAVYNEDSLRAILEDAGFTDIERQHLFTVKENQGFDDAMLLPWSLNMRCRKPDNLTNSRSATTSEL